MAQAHAKVWVDSLESVGWYSCDVRPADDPDRIDWAKYEQVTMMGLSKPSPDLWGKIADFVKKGGHLIIVPGGPEMDASSYRTEGAGLVVPRKFTSWAAVKPSITWTWNTLSPQRPILSVFRNYREQNSFFDTDPPSTFGFWKIEDGFRDRMVVAYNDAPDPDKRSPAILEWGHGLGRIYQFTVPLALGSRDIHNYAGSWFYMVLANEAVRTLAGDSEDQTFNFTNGQMVLVKWPAGEVKPGATYYLSGPDVTATDSNVKREEGQAYFRMGPEKTGSAGAFTLTAADGKWTDGFSLNVPTEESNLERIAPDSIQELFGADAISPADKKLPLSEILSGKFTQPIELFPFLMILLLIVLAVENWMGNRFYRRKRLATTQGRV